MANSPSFSTVNIKNALEALEQLGFRSAAAEIRGQPGFDSPDFGSDQSRISLDQVETFWRAAERLTGDPDIGLHLAEKGQASGTSVVYHLLMSSANILEGLQRLIRYEQVIGESTLLSVSESDNVVALTYNNAEPQVLGRTQAEYFALVNVRMMAWLLDRDVVAERVQFAHDEPDDISEHHRLFGCPIFFSCDNNHLVLSRDIAQSPSPHANRHLVEVFENVAAGYLSSLKDRQLIEAVTAEISKQVLLGPVSLGTVAKGVATTERKLKQILAAEGLSFSELYEAYRKERAENLLSSSEYSITDVGYLCGYTESSSFVRAFRRWHDVSPRQYRKDKA